MMHRRGKIEDGLRDAENVQTGETGNSLKDTENAPVSELENDFQGAEVVFEQCRFDI